MGCADSPRWEAITSSPKPFAGWHGRSPRSGTDPIPGANGEFIRLSRNDLQAVGLRGRAAARMSLARSLRRDIRPEEVSVAFPGGKPRRPHDGLNRPSAGPKLVCRFQFGNFGCRFGTAAPSGRRRPRRPELARTPDPRSDSRAVDSRVRASTLQETCR